MRPIADVYPLTAMQQGILLSDARAVAGSASDDEGPQRFVNQIVLRLGASVDRGALQRAWSAIVDRHAVLRTSIQDLPGASPLQVVHQPVVDAIMWHRLVDGDSLDAFLARDRRAGFALHRPPLSRFAGLHTGPQEILVWTFHHILLDGWSAHLILAELSEAYATETARRPTILAQRRPFRDYVQWESGQDKEAAAAYWASALPVGSAPTGLESSPRAITGGGGGTDPDPCVRIPPADTARLRQFGRDGGVSMATLVNAAWALTLNHFAGVRRPIFGVVVATRPATLTGADAMIGLLLNTLPFSVDTCAQWPVGQWLRRMQADQIDMTSFAYATTREIQRWSQIDSAASLFDTATVFENYPIDIGTSRPDGLPIAAIEYHQRTDLSLRLLVHGSKALAIDLGYNPSHHRLPAVRRVLAHVVEILCALPAHALARPQELPTVIADDPVRLAGPNAGGRTDEDTFYDRFARTAAERPDRVALMAGDTAVTYGDLADRAARVSGWLTAHGLVPGRLIGVALARSIDAATALLGVAASGAAYLVLDPASPPDRLAQTMSEAALAAVIADLPSRPAWLPPAVPMLDLEGRLVNGPKPVGSPGFAGVAYVCFTSGSTGRPKGIVTGHLSVIDYLDGLIADARLTTADVVLQLAPLTFDASVRDLFGPLIAGATVVLLPDGDCADPAGIRQAIRDRGVTCLLSVVPTIFRAWSVAWRDELISDTVRLVAFSGEPLDGTDIASCRVHFGPETVVVNQYGPSECTMTTTRMVVNGPAEPGPVPIGTPGPGAWLRVLDARLRPVPWGAVGEICIGGPGLAHGYLGRPVETAEAFVPDPRATTAGARLYRTGDLGRFLEDGSVELLGRRDGQIKRYGVRVDLDGVSATMRAMPGVADAVTVPTSGLPPHLCCYLVANGDGNSELAVRARAWAIGRLPYAATPTGFVVVDELPRTATGKVDRSKLPTDVAGSTWVAPRTPHEKAIAEIWARVLDIPAVGAIDSFFSLGGDSMLGLRVIKQVADELGLPLTLGDLFAAPTVAGLVSAAVARLPAQSQAL